VTVISLQNKVVDMTRRLIEQAERGFRVSIPAPVLRFDLTGRAAGMVVFSRTGALIRYNQKLLTENGDTFLDQTVPHEVAHLVARTLHGAGIRPHGPEWKLIMAFFGAPAHRCHNFTTSSLSQRRMRYFNYRCDCQDHKLSAVRHNRCRSGVTYLCRSCGSPLVSLSYD
jgi:SprT protein